MMNATIDPLSFTPLDVMSSQVLRLCSVSSIELERLLARFGLKLQRVADEEPIPGSYWGECEAGLIGATLYARQDTPLQSVLHEASHYICMDAARRAVLNRDAGGNDDEENAVCYLQIVLADQVAGLGAARMLSDMDAWGYTFRLGSARAWFEHEADDAHRWLVRAGLLEPPIKLTWRVRC